MRWDTKIEKKLIKMLGGTPRQSYGHDGIIRGRPVEVRSVKKDDRFRIQKDVHKHLVKNEGSYIFCDANTMRVKKILAKKVSKLLSRDPWLKDRKYPHKFLKKKEVF